MSFKDTFYQLCHWKTWDWRIKYVLLLPSWLWYCLRSRNFWFFTSSNPSLTFGGFDGQGKMEMYRQLPPGSYPKTIPISPEWNFAEVMQLFTRFNFTFPVVVKPDIGKMGLMFRKAESINDLRRYHQNMPVNYVLQDFVPYPIEVSVFYFRFPGAATGTITGFIEKGQLAVTGDGSSTLADLISDCTQARFRKKELLQKHREKLNDIIAKGQTYCLSHALNLSRGSRLVNLDHEKDNRLLQVFDRLSDHSQSLFYGRYDIKCQSIDDLKEGKNFLILEFNGSGGEPHHVYAGANSLLNACSELVRHWSILFRISQANHSRGVPYWEFSEGFRYLMAARRHNKMLERLDRQFPLL